MKNVVILFSAGIIVALLAVGGYLVGRTYFVSADEDLIPRNINIERTSPTAASIQFTTDQPTLASIECSTSPDGPFSLCGAESVETENHDIKTSIILDPEQEYYFFIKIRNVTYDNLGSAFEIPLKREDAASFPTNLMGLCTGDTGYNATYDVNKDGCIRQNDRLLYSQ